MLQSSDHCGPPMGLFQCVHVFLVLEAAELDAALQVSSQDSRVEGNNHLPSSACHTTFNAAQDTAVFVGCEDALLGFVELFLNQHAQFILVRAAINPFTTQPAFVFGVVLTQAQNSHLLLSNLMKFPWACFSSLSVSLRTASLPSSVSSAPHSLVLLANLLRMHSIHCPCCQQRC